MRLYSELKYKYQHINSRSRIVMMNVINSFIYKGLSIVLSLLIIPLTIDYINAENYGVWLTISSIVGWIGYFDLGLGHGLRNRFAEAKANGDINLQSKLLSTTYVLLVMIFGTFFTFFMIINTFVDWSQFLGVSQIDNNYLRKIMIILAACFSVNMVLSTIKSLLLGDQKTSDTSLLVVLEQFISLICIYFLTKTVEPDLKYLVIVYSGVPCIVLAISTVFFYCPRLSRYHHIRPSFKSIDFSLSKSLLSLGGKFFVIQVCLLIVFQSVNIIISRNCGQMAVAQYHISYKYFQIIYMVSVIIFTPYWSAFSDAFAKEDYAWMKSSLRKLDKLVILSIPMIGLMLLMSPLFFKLWVGGKVEVPFSMSLIISLYVLLQISSGMHTYLTNGIGKVMIQSIVYVIASFFAIPLMDFLSRLYGIYGLLLVLILIYISQTITCRIQLIKLLERKANGIWNK